MCCTRIVVGVLITTLCVVGCGSDSSDPREPVVKCYNGYLGCQREYIGHWAKYQESKTKDEQLSHLSKCRDALKQIQPFEPLGVDPKVAEAINEYKKVALEYVAFLVQEIEQRKSDPGQRERLRKRKEDAQMQIEVEMNRFANEHGGLSRRGSQMTK